MTKLKNLAYLLLFGAGLLSLKYFVIDRVFVSAPKDSEVWFTSGLLLIVLGVFVTEKYFTRSLDVIVNVITLIVVLLTLDRPEDFRLWTPVFIYVVGEQRIVDIFHQIVARHGLVAVRRAILFLRHGPDRPLMFFVDDAGVCLAFEFGFMDASNSAKSPK